nr:immunoglobulin heavy chain junction region [Mus musculus]
CVRQGDYYGSSYFDYW